MASKRDYYSVLGVSRSATADELRAAHRRLARELHPDINKAPDAAQKFAEVQEAYDVLSDDAKRRLYDQIGHERFAAGGAAYSAQQGAGPGRGPRNQTYTWTNVGGAPHANPFDAEDIGSIFEEVFGGGRARDAGWGGGGARQRARRKGRDVEHEVSVPFDLALTGGSYTLRLTVGDDAETIDIKIPRGVADGARLRLKAKGQPAPSGGERGDLFLTIRVAPHPYFRREGEAGRDIAGDVPISITEAALGAKVPVRTPGGAVDVTIPAGTPSGARLRLRGRGVETDSGVKGDFYAIVKIIPPKGLSADDEAALRDLASRLAPPTGDARA